MMSISRITLLFCIALISFQTLNAQDIFRAKKFRLGLTVTPAYNFRFISGDDSFQSVLDYRNQQDEGKFGYSAGLSLLIDVKKHFTIETGVQYTNAGQRTTLDSLVGQVFNGNITQNWNLNYLEIPLKLQVNLINRKVRLYASGGISASVFLFENTITKIDLFNGNSSKINSNNSNFEPNPILLNALLGVGLEYHFNRILSLRLEPTFTYGLIRANSNNQNVAYHPYSIGGNIGLFFGL